MAYIPFEKMKALREAAKNGDERARKIIAMQLAGKDDFAPFTQEIHKEVRKLSAFVEDDRELDAEATAVAQWLKSTPLFA